MFQESKNLTPLGQLGEFGLINHLTKNYTLKNENVVVGIGDDAAAYIPSEKTLQLITTDMLVQGVHFDLAYVPLQHLGYKSVVVNVSDIVAMGGKPSSFTISIAVSAKFTVEALEAFYNGVYAACDAYNLTLLGGDTTSALQGMTISITMLGEVLPQNLIKRSGAKQGDLICVTGDLGAAFVGLNLLEREKRIFLENPNIQPDLDNADYVIKRQLKPEARMEIINALENWGVLPTSMIDISDGLASELIHIAQASKVGVRIYEEKLPIDHSTRDLAFEFGLDPTVCAMHGGEDYELLFTISQSDYEKLKDKSDIAIIGHVTDPSFGAILVTNSGSEMPITAQGWNAFNSNLS